MKLTDLHRYLVEINDCKLWSYNDTATQAIYFNPKFPILRQLIPIVDEIPDSYCIQVYIGLKIDPPAEHKELYDSWVNGEEDNE